MPPLPRTAARRRIRMPPCGCVRSPCAGKGRCARRRWASIPRNSGRTRSFHPWYNQPRNSRRCISCSRPPCRWRDGGSLISVPRHSQSVCFTRISPHTAQRLPAVQAGAGAGGRNAGNRHLDVALGFAHGNRDRIAHFVAAVALYIILRGLGAGGDAGQFVGSLVRKAVVQRIATATVAVSLTSSQRSHCT